MRKSKEIRTGRLKYAIPGFVIGVVADVVIRWLLGAGFEALEALMAGLAAAGFALWYGERFSGLATADDLAVMKLREEMSPLDLESDRKVPATLKTMREKKI